MRDVHYLDALARVTEQMASGGGAFLTVPGRAPNTMTVGWGSVGYLWRAPVFLALVRRSRHTFPMLNEAGRFTVSVPAPGTMKAELAFAGTRSGRDVDKFSGHGLTAAPARFLDAPIVAECPLHFECVVKYAHDMDPAALDDAIVKSCYEGYDMHRMYYGEIVGCYET